METLTTASFQVTANDEATGTVQQALQLAAGLHVAGRDPHAWRAILKECSEWLGCTGLLALPSGDSPLDADVLEVLAASVSHCAVYGYCACGGQGDSVRRGRCAALAPHLHEVAAEARNALHALFFDLSPPTWIVDKKGRVHDSNTTAKEIAAAREPLAVVDGLLTPIVPGGAANLRRALAELVSDTRFVWPDTDGGETTLLLRHLPVGAGVAVTLLPRPPSVGQLAPCLARRLQLTVRQSDLAAHLLVGCTLSDAARAMGISRHTANEHLEGLLKRVDALDRRRLLVVLRSAVTG